MQTAEPIASPAASPARVFDLYVADRYRRDCPGNISPRRVGYGMTAARAIGACLPWENQKRYFVHEARRVMLTDRPLPRHSDIRAVAWIACRCADGTLDKDIGEHLRAGRLATACELAARRGYIA